MNKKAAMVLAGLVLFASGAVMGFIASRLLGDRGPLAMIHGDPRQFAAMALHRMSSDLDLTDEQQLLKDTFAKLFQDQSTPARVRAAAPLGFDRKLWSALVELGTPLVRVPEEAGGLGLSLHDAAIIAEEAGRHLASVPLVEIIVTARLLGAAGAKAAPWIDRVARGDAIIVTALEPATGEVGQIVPGGAVAAAVLALDG
jgi:alkylation response protein AidB-like acyl-CoA dehydrogenase